MKFKEKISFVVAITTILTVSVSVCAFAISQDNKESYDYMNDKALYYINEMQDTSWVNRADTYANKSSAYTNRQILLELKDMNKTLDEINKKLDN